MTLENCITITEVNEPAKIKLENISVVLLIFFLIQFSFATMHERPIIFIFVLSLCTKITLIASSVYVYLEDEHHVLYV